MKRKRGVILLSFLFILLTIINYNLIDEELQEFVKDSETGIVERIVDGDTAIINGNSTRFLGINTPEKGEKYYNEAKEFLAGLILNKTITLEYGKDKYDKYKRKLAFIFLNSENINIEQVRNGFANVYILEDKLYEPELHEAWNECLISEKNLCKKSTNKCADCIELEDFNFDEQEIIFENKCNFNCDLSSWTIKDEGRKKFSFSNFVLERNEKVEIVVGNRTDSDEVLYWRDEEYVWTETGDSLFLRDENGDLVMYKQLA